MRKPIAVGAATYLRKPSPGDANEFTTRAKDSRDHLHPFVYTAESRRTFLPWISRGDRLDCEQFLVCRRSDDAIAGFINLNAIIRGSQQQATAGWASFRPLAGAGHMREGLSLVLEVAFTTLRLHRVEANIQPNNARSRNLAARAGFRLEGFSPSYLQIAGDWKDHERWGALEADWRDAVRRERNRHLRP